MNQESTNGGKSEEAVPPPLPRTLPTLIQCPACGRQVSPNAASCPRCGETIKKAQSATGIVAPFVIGCVIGLPLYFAITSSSEYQVEQSKKILEMSRRTDQLVGDWNTTH